MSDAIIQSKITLISFPMNKNKYERISKPAVEKTVLHLII
jgi:hypothetical protein